MNCSIEGCERRRRYAGSGWCQTHYHRWYRTGTTDLIPRQIDPYTWTYRTAHAHVQDAFGPASDFVCVTCGAPAKEWAYDGADPTAKYQMLTVGGVDYPVTYSVWPEFYMPMCFTCHRLFDGSARRERAETYGCGHPHTDENTVWRPGGRPNGCRVCKLVGDRAGYQRRKAAARPGQQIQREAS